jgi:predicted glycosyltransferase
MSHRVLFYVQHLLGVGHLKRAEILAGAMAEAGLEVTVALGGRPLAEAPFRRVRTVQLPPATIANEDFSALLDGDGRPVDEKWKAERAAALMDLHRRTDPDVLLLELFPFGRRQFRFELLPLLERVRGTARPARVACSVRDILVAAKKHGQDSATAELVRRHFDAVLVHGDPALIPFEATFTEEARIADLIRYTGYVAAPLTPAEAAGGSGEVLVSAGGGAVGSPLLFAALAARPFTPVADRTWRLLAGPNCPDDAFGRIAAMADRCTIVERFRDDFPARLRVAALSISQAGYNTTMDVLRAGVPAVVVPYEAKGETEQQLRAGILAERGLLSAVPAAELTPERLAAAIADTLARPRLTPNTIDFSGAATTAELVGELAERRRG